MKLFWIQIWMSLYVSVSLVSCSHSMIHSSPGTLDLLGKTEVSERADGGIEIEVEAGNFNQKAVALEGFHLKAQKKYKTGSYAYAYNVRQTGENKHTGDAGLTSSILVANSSSALEAGIFAAGTHFFAEAYSGDTYEVKGYAKPRQKVSLAAGSSVYINYVDFPELIGKYDAKDKKLLNRSIVEVLLDLKLNPVATKSKARYVLDVTTLRWAAGLVSTQEATVELVLRKNKTKRPIAQAFLKEKPKGILPSTRDVDEYILTRIRRGFDEMLRVQ